MDTTRECGRCDRRANSTCSRCKVERYCSPSCQKKHWPSHRHACRAVGTAPPLPRGTKFSAPLDDAATMRKMMVDSGEIAPREACGNCGKVGPDLKKCAKCLNRWFCGRECQLKDWTLHRTVCRAAPPFVAASQRFPDSKLVLCSEVLKSKFEKQLHGRHFSGVIKARYEIQSSLDIVDSSGGELFVSFYLLAPSNPAPFFRFKELVEGAHITIFNPTLHRFRDGHVGFRIEDPAQIDVARTSP
jgi:MYND finger